MAHAAASAPPASPAPIAETPLTGLTSAQVAERRPRGLTNAGGEPTSRSVAEILRANIFAIPAGGIIAAATFAAYALAHARSAAGAAAHGATLVTLILSLCVLVLLAIPLTWRRILLVGAVLAGFVLLFPVPAVRRFYALQLPHSGLATTLVIAALGAAALAGFWVLSRRRGRGPPPVVRQ